MRAWSAPEEQRRFGVETQKDGAHSPTEQESPEPHPLLPDSPEVQLAMEWAHLGGD